MLASCGLAFTAQTDQVYTPAIGVNDRIGQVDVLDALIVTSKDGGAGTLVAGLVNDNETQSDALTGVTGAKQDSNLTVQASGTPVTLGPNSLYQLADAGNFKVYGDQLVPGSFVWVTFNFQNAQSVTMDIPVTTPYNGLGKVPLPSSTVPTTPAPPAPTATPLHKKHKPKQSTSPSSSPTS